MSDLNNLNEDEPYFVLRGQDASAVKTIFLWMAENCLMTPEHKLRQAFEKAMEMRDYENNKHPD